MFLLFSLTELNCQVLEEISAKMTRVLVLEGLKIWGDEIGTVTQIMKNTRGI